MPPSEPWTVGRLLGWTADYFKDHGSDNARLDAEVLLAKALSCRRIELYTRFDEQPGDDVKAAFRELVRRRAAGEPVAYLVGRREFYSLSFRVTPAVLIPRPETEHLVIALLDLARARGDGGACAVADVGTGSGAIAVCVARHLPGCRVTAIDASPAALEVARQNAADHGVADRIDFVQSDLFASVDGRAAFDFIVSNPPYVADSELDQLAEEVRRFEPREALLAGPRGTEVIERLVPQAAERLRPGGHLLIEISPTIHTTARHVLESDPHFAPPETIKDLSRQPRVLVARKQ